MKSELAFERFNLTKYSDRAILRILDIHRTYLSTKLAVPVQPRTWCAWGIPLEQNHSSIREASGVTPNHLAHIHHPPKSRYLFWHNDVLPFYYFSIVNMS
jgi:hypothetical protein